MNFFPTLHRKHAFIRAMSLLACALVLMLTQQYLYNGLRSVFGTVLYPLQQAQGLYVQWKLQLGGMFQSGSDLRSEVAFLREELQQAKQQLAVIGALSNENLRLRAALRLQEALPFTTVYARVIYRDGGMNGDSLLVNKGTAQAIRRGMPVITFNTDGQAVLVGKTTEVNTSFAKVQVITSRDAHIGVLLMNSRNLGLLTGSGSWVQNTSMDFVPMQSNPVVGEIAVTSGHSDIYPYGIRVGTVVAIGKSVVEDFFQKIYVQPEFMYSAVQDVFIVDYVASPIATGVNE